VGSPPALSKGLDWLSKLVGGHGRDQAHRQGEHDGGRASRNARRMDRPSCASGHRGREIR